MKIVILDGNAVNPGDLSWDWVGKYGDYTVYGDTKSEEEAIARAKGCDIILNNKVPITARLLDACPSVRYIGIMATGYNVVDLQAAKERSIPVTNVPSYGTAAVAQFTFGLLLELCHQIGLHNSLVHQGEWGRAPSFCFWRTPQWELAGKTLGIIGFGRIGQAVAKIAKSFDMRVITYSRTETEAGKQLAEYVSLETLLKTSDIISLHCPLFPETEKMICAENIQKMKDGVVLLNTSRGGLIDEADVAEALHSGKIRAAAVDVVSKEPMPDTNPLLTAPNCIITPHMAWAPIESRKRLVECVIGNLDAYLAGNPRNVVNP